MNYFMKSKAILIIMTSVLVLIFTACNSAKITEESNDRDKTIRPTIALSSEESDKPVLTIGAGRSGATEEPTNTDKESDKTEASKEIFTDEHTKEPKLEDFSRVKEYFKDYIFHLTYDEDLEHQDRTYTIYGSYDLNGDGKEDRIEALLKYRYDKSYIEINGIKKFFYPDSPSGEMHIIDIDNNDNYVELAIFDDGPSGDPIYEFFRYDGKEVYNLGSIDEFAWMDGQGKFISNFHTSTYLSPRFISAWGEFKDGEFHITNHDVEQYKGKTYEVDGRGYFIPLDKNPEEFSDHIVWELEAVREFNSMEIRLIDIHMYSWDRTLNHYYVELADGERGLLYFWIGD